MRRAVPIMTALLALSGCTLPGFGAGQSSAPPSGGTSASAPASPGQQGTPSATATPTATALPELASRTINISGTPATITLNEVVVRNGATSITWTLTNNRAADSGGLGIQMTAGFFGDGRIATVPGTNQDVSEDQYYVDGAYLLDTVNRLRYLPARDAEGHCVCTYAPSSVFVRPGASQSFDAVFKALPDDVTTVDVVIPRAGTFRAVPVQR